MYKTEGGTMLPKVQDLKTKGINSIKRCKFFILLLVLEPRRSIAMPRKYLVLRICSKRLTTN